MVCNNKEYIIDMVSDKYELLSFVKSKLEMLFGIPLLGVSIFYLMKNKIEVFELLLSFAIFMIISLVAILSHFFSRKGKKVSFLMEEDKWIIVVEKKKYDLQKILVSKREKMTTLHYESGNLVNQVFKTKSSSNVFFYEDVELKIFIEKCENLKIPISTY